MGLVISKGLTLRKGYIGTDDPDAEAYIAAVEAADLAADPTAEPLETATKVAIHSFVKGAKADGFWPAIKASCILAGARTRLGALTPLVGTAPTSLNFVDGDYNRKTGLVGDGTTKYLNSNRNNNADPQNNKHIAVYFGAALSSGSANNRAHLGIAPASGQAGASVISTDPTGATVDSGRYRANGTTAAVVASGLATGLKAVTRSNSSEIVSRQSGESTTTANTSEARLNGNLFVFARNHPSALDYSNARIAFYSIGESLDLALLDARVTDLINAFAAAIP
jgi:hypothetical protein